MPETIDLTGAWAGEYYQHNRPHPISAELVQDGERLTGSMSDGVTEQSSSVFEIASEVGLPPGADEQIEARLRAMLPDSGGAPIRYVSHLPHESALEGWVSGPNVYFLKTYQGTSFGGYQVGDVLVGHQTETHAVHYSGTLSPDGREIEGRWWIAPNDETGAMKAEGSFTLRHQEA